jgi:hypothetical protein
VPHRHRGEAELASFLRLPESLGIEE